MARSAVVIDSPARRVLKRVAWATAGIALLVFAVQGGEYSTPEVLDARAHRQRLQAEVTAKRAELDSLKVEYKAVSTDPARLERLARERFGMVQGDKELLYWVGGSARAEADSGTTNDSLRAIKAAPAASAAKRTSGTSSRG